MSELKVYKILGLEFDSQFYHKSEADKEFRKLQRALWLARAERAEEIHFMWCQFIYDRKYGIVKFNVKKEWGENIKKGQILHTPQGWADVWEEVERKCRAYSDKFKESK